MRKTTALARLLLVSTLTFSLLLPACAQGQAEAIPFITHSPDNTVGIETGAIATDNPVFVAEGALGPAGGSLKVVQTNPLRGLQIEVPAGAYAEPVTFRASYLPITGQTFGGEFLTPVIEIDDGAAFAAEAVLLTIPVQPPPGAFAMAFFYDAQGTLEALPPIAVTPQAITVAARHFGQLVVRAFREAELAETVFTAFRPAADGWQFNNPLTYASPAGACLGQCLTALWYFAAQVPKDSHGLPESQAARLYGQYNNGTPALEADDVLALRLVGVVQRDYNDLLTRVLARLPTPGDATTWQSLLAALRTGRPQLVSIDNPHTRAGHALIAYGASYDVRQDSGRLYLADPNHAGRTSTIAYRRGRFEPYRDFPAYTRVRHLGVTPYADWEDLAGHWQEFENRTVGSAIFPAYTIQYGEGGELRPLTDGLTTTSSNLNLRAVTDSGQELQVRIYLDDKSTPEADLNKVTLQKGANRPGLEILAEAQGDEPAPSWVDFKYLSVYYEPAS